MEGIQTLSEQSELVEIIIGISGYYLEESTLPLWFDCPINLQSKLTSNILIVESKLPWLNIFHRVKLTDLTSSLCSYYSFTTNLLL